jgi:hypothetical protein
MATVTRTYAFGYGLIIPLLIRPCQGTYSGLLPLLRLRQLHHVHIMALRCEQQQPTATPNKVPGHLLRSDCSALHTVVLLAALSLTGALLHRQQHCQRCARITWVQCNQRREYVMCA